MDEIRNQAIGVFDSGIGGLTVANAIVDLLPNERLIYFGDTAHLPYGDKSPQAITEYTLKVCDFLIQQSCKAIVIACNSASAAAYDSLYSRYPDSFPIINVVDPLVEEVKKHRFNSVGIIATRATINSGIYQRKIAEQVPFCTIGALAAPLLVPMIEEGFVRGEISSTILEEYLSSGELKDKDALLLACTHYPLIKESFRELLPKKTKILDSAHAAATELRSTLQANGLMSDSRKEAHMFYVSDFTKDFETTASMFMGSPIHLKKLAFWD